MRNGFIYEAVTSQVITSTDRLYVVCLMHSTKVDPLTLKVYKWIIIYVIGSYRLSLMHACFLNAFSTTSNWELDHRGIDT